jgi:hypothetical protein
MKKLEEERLRNDKSTEDAESCITIEMGSGNETYGTSIFESETL